MTDTPRDYYGATIEENKRLRAQVANLEATLKRHEGCRLRDIAENKRLRAQVAEEERVALQMAVAAGKADARVAFLEAQLAALEEDGGRELARLRAALEPAPQMMLDYGKAIHMKSVGLVEEAEAIRAVCLAWHRHACAALSPTTAAPETRKLTREDVEMFDAALYASGTFVDTPVAPANTRTEQEVMQHSSDTPGADNVTPQATSSKPGADTPAAPDAWQPIHNLIARWDEELTRDPSGRVFNPIWNCIRADLMALIRATPREAQKEKP